MVLWPQLVSGALFIALTSHQKFDPEPFFGRNQVKGACTLEIFRSLSIRPLICSGCSHHTPQAILLGLEGAFVSNFILFCRVLNSKGKNQINQIGSDPETIDTGTIPSRYTAIQQTKTLMLGGYHRIHYDMDRDMLWRFDLVLKTHPNGMRFSCFDVDGDLIATNEYFSVGGGFVVNEKTKG